MFSSMEAELQFIELQNPGWPPGYFKREITIFAACNKDWENKRQKFLRLFANVMLKAGSYKEQNNINHKKKGSLMLKIILLLFIIPYDRF